MSDAPHERLYALLPAVYRLRDAAIGSPMRALLAVMDRRFVEALEEDVARLYENWFIETCDEWVVPYLGDLLGVRGLNPVAARISSQRTYVANVLSHRRRKGTAAMLEQLAQDLTGWPAHAVEFFQVLSTTQHLNHLRRTNLRTPDLRQDGPLGLLGGPFETAAHVAEVRRIASGRGRYGIQNVGLFLWRIASDPITRADAAVAADQAGAAGLFRFSPLGQDVPLFNRRRVEEDVARLSTEELVPAPLRRRPLFDDLAAFRASRAKLGPKAPKDSLYLGTRPVLALSVAGVDLPPEALRICNLADWRPPPDVAPVPGTWPAECVAVDPLLGRIAFATSVAPAQPPQVSFYQGFGGALGGGGYPRPGALPAAPPRVSGGGTVLSARLAGPLPYAAVTAADQRRRIERLRGGSGRDADGGTFVPLAERLRDLLSVAGQSYTIEIGDSRSYSLAAIDVPAGCVLEIRAANGQRPLVRLEDPAKVTVGKEGVLILDGFLVAGMTLTVDAPAEAALVVQHSTLVPGLSLAPDGNPASAGSRSVLGPAGPSRFDLLVYRSITGPLHLPGDDGHIYLEDSIADAASGPMPALSASNASVTRATIAGETEVQVLDLASDTIFTGTVTVQRVQEGCVRFSFVPDGSRVPQPYRCQPAMALETSETSPAVRADRDLVLARVVPSFTSLRYGEPAYTQLSASCAPEVRRGASDGGSMGAWNFLQEPQREDNLRTSLDEYLRFGLEAGIFFVT